MQSLRSITDPVELDAFVEKFDGAELVCQIVIKDESDPQNVRVVYRSSEDELVADRMKVSLGIARTSMTGNWMRLNGG